MDISNIQVYSLASIYLYIHKFMHINLCSIIIKIIYSINLSVLLLKYLDLLSFRLISCFLKSSSYQDSTVFL